MDNFRQHRFEKTLTESASSFVFNPKPLFVPPPKMFESLELESLDKKCSEAKALIEKYHETISQCHEVQRKRKKMHWFAAKVVKNSDAIDIFHNDIIVKRIGKRRKVSSMRRDVVKELMRALAITHDIFTGLCPKSCITLLSDQIGVTTYGLKRYGKYDEMDLLDTDVRGKKKSISRVSLALKLMEELGLIIKHYDRDPITGKDLPVLIEVTDEYYKVLLIALEERDKARFDKARQVIIKNAEIRKRKGGVELQELPTDPENLQAYINQKIVEVKMERRKFAQLQRKRKYLKNMSNKDIHLLAQSEVKSNVTAIELDRMSETAFTYLVAQRQRQLITLRGNFRIEDDGFKSSYYQTDPFH